MKEETWPLGSITVKLAKEFLAGDGKIGRLGLVEHLTWFASIGGLCGPTFCAEFLRVLL